MTYYMYFIQTYDAPYGLVCDLDLTFRGNPVSKVKGKLKDHI